jgi:putative transposase
VAADKKKARRLKATLIFLDESGHSLMPHVAKTWGLAGLTPVLKCRGRHRQKVSTITAITVSPKARRLGLLFRTYLNRSIDQHRVLHFVKQLAAHRRGPIVLIMDNINTHKSKLLKTYLKKHRRLHEEPLPAYAPDLNPVEWFFEDAKCHELANHGLLDVLELRKRVQQHGRRLNRDPHKLRGFLRSAKLPWKL